MAELTVDDAPCMSPWPCLFDRPSLLLGIFECRSNVLVGMVDHFDVQCSDYNHDRMPL
jgi:hypothetical protein